MAYFFILVLWMANIQLAFSNDVTSLENCTDPYNLCPSDILSVTLNSIEIHPNSYDKGGRKNTALELSYYLELGLQGHYTNVLMYWEDAQKNFPANFEDKSYEVSINKKYTSMLKTNINLYNIQENTDLDDFYSKINFVVKEARTIGKSTLCNIALAKPDHNNKHAFNSFISMVRDANENDTRKAQTHINLICIPNNESARITFKFLFEFERQQID